MKQNKVNSARLGEGYTRIDHPTGLTMLLCPMEGFSSAYALFGTKYGSVDTCFKTGGEADFVTVPEGIAHFLEHKLFESEEGDAFTRYAKTGANANAYTTFDRTAYLFSCSENFEESLEILLDFVTHPYFTQETVEKEQGIIGQEIGMYDDNADSRVFFNMLKALYHNNPVRIDITGTVESIAKIDADLLYRCYHTFYNLNNMVLAIAGNFDVDTVLAVADRVLKPAQPITIQRGATEPEPEGVCQSQINQMLPVALPLFHIGFKGVPGGDEAESARLQVLDEILLDIIAGDASPLYRALYDEGLINQTFGADAMASRDYSLTVFGGESRDPEAVHTRICAEIDRIGKEGLDPAVFARSKKALYGRYLGAFGRVDGMAGLMLTAHFAGITPYDLPEVIAGATLEELQDRLARSFDTNRCALSVVRSGE